MPPQLVSSKKSSLVLPTTKRHTLRTQRRSGGLPNSDGSPFTYTIYSKCYDCLVRRSIIRQRYLFSSSSPVLRGYRIYLSYLRPGAQFAPFLQMAALTKGSGRKAISPKLFAHFEEQLRSYVPGWEKSSSQSSNLLCASYKFLPTMSQPTLSVVSAFFLGEPRTRTKLRLDFYGGLAIEILNPEHVLNKIKQQEENTRTHFSAHKPGLSPAWTLPGITPHRPKSGPSFTTKVSPHRRQRHRKKYPTPSNGSYSPTGASLTQQPTGCSTLQQPHIIEPTFRGVSRGIADHPTPLPTLSLSNKLFHNPTTQCGSNNRPHQPLLPLSPHKKRTNNTCLSPNTQRSTPSPNESLTLPK